MRAKTINESLNFERKRDPKIALGLRTYDLNEELSKFDENEIDWVNFLEKTFIGRKITGYMAKGDNDTFGGLNEKTTRNPVIAIFPEEFFPDFSFVTIEPGTWVHNKKYEYTYDKNEVFYYVDMDKQNGKLITIVG